MLISNKLGGGAVGAGLVLVLLPSLALVAGALWLPDNRIVSLPVLAIFGVMILFGAMALTSTLFVRLGYGARGEALALPPGSIRAAIALALIVLFAIISIMLFQSMGEPYPIRHLTEAEANGLSNDPRNRVFAIRTDECRPPAAGPAAAIAGPCFQVQVVRGPTQDAIDLAKQLLILIGTLMTSVTSFYFAAQTSTAAVQAVAGAARAASGAAGGVAPLAVTPAPSPVPTAAARNGTAPAAERDASSSTSGSLAEEEHSDGEPLSVAAATSDEELPPATGGVA